jgi:hypothetical protein
MVELQVELLEEQQAAPEQQVDQPVELDSKNKKDKSLGLSFT